MKLGKVAIAASTCTFATLLSFGWCEQRGVSLSVESAQARVGRPLTPVSVAGVARRQNRRAAYGYGAAAVGAAAVGAAGYYGPSYTYGGGPNNQGGLVGGDDSGTRGFGRASYGFTGATGTYRVGYGAGAGYYGGGPYYTSAGYYGPGYAYGGGPNNQGGLVGGDDSGTRGFGRASYGFTGSTGTYRVGYGAGSYYGPGYAYGGGPNNQGGLVGGDDSGTRGFGRASYGFTGSTGTYRVGYGAGARAGYYGPSY